jgi:hypothetical protein
MGLGIKLMNIQSELKAPKSRKNSFGNYYYRSCEDILEAVKPLLKANGCILTISDSVEVIGERYYVKATATIADIENEDRISNSALARETADKKGQDDSQITGTASSYARKYALNGLFLIDDTKDADTDEAHREKEARAKKAEDEKKNEALITDIGSMKIPEIKVKVLQQDIENGITDEEKLLKFFKVEKLEDVTEAQFRDYVDKRNKAEKE